MLQMMRRCGAHRVGGLPRRSHRRSSGQQGFTLLELIIVIAVVGVLAAIAMPNLTQTPRRAQEAVLRTNLNTLRQVVDQYNGDKGFYPSELEVLIDDGYLRDIPYDPITGEQEWGLIYEGSPDDLNDPDSIAWDVDLELDGGGIIDVFSLSEDLSLDETPYAEW